MTYTSHGHHIPFTFLEATKPERVEGCGGVRVCLVCTLEAAEYLPAFDGNGLEPLLAAREIVDQRIQQYLREDGGDAHRDNYILYRNVVHDPMPASY